MTPDMERLCDVALDAAISSDCDGFACGRAYQLKAAEAVVRAVLAALRHPSNQAWLAGDDFARRWYEDDANGDSLDLEGCFRAVIDHILAEPATA